MSNLKITQIRGRGLPLPGDDIDTDRITPARFLRAITFEGMEKALFCDERENVPDHPLDNPDYRGANIMFVGKNFGSGSSREHAPQAIKRYGFWAIVGVSFAEIFAGNSLAIGLPLVSTTAENIQKLIAHTQARPKTEYTLDLETMKLTYDGESIDVEMLEERRISFLNGTWNVLEILKTNLPKVREVSERLPYLHGFEN